MHDEHSGSTYWLDNAFGVDDLVGDLRFGTGLDNQRAVTVKSTFLQNRAYLDFYYREAFTVVEMEAGPTATRSTRSPTPIATRSARRSTSRSSRIDFGIIHYASDTPYTQARTLGRPRSLLLRDGLDVRLVAGDLAAGLAAGGRAGLRRKPGPLST